MFASISFHVFLFLLRALKIVVVPDSSAAQKVPAVDGLLEYRKDKQELFVRSNNTWNALAQETVSIIYLHFFMKSNVIVLSTGCTCAHVQKPWVRG